MYAFQCSYVILEIVILILITVSVLLHVALSFVHTLSLLSIFQHSELTVDIHGFLD